MKNGNPLLKYFLEQGGKNSVNFPDGALSNPSYFPLSSLETKGAILFIDLSDYSKIAEKFEPVECAYFVNHFFAWFEGEALNKYNGIIDKFIGDEVMVVFPHTECKTSPLESAIYTAKLMLASDPFGFSPKIGIATGIFSIAIIGTTKAYNISAIGSTVNLASRCVAKSKGPNSIRIATDNINLIKSIFNDDNIWEVSNIKDFLPKNMSKVKVIDIKRKTIWLPNFDYSNDVKLNVNIARDKGVIISNI